jgi:uncharacterized membrane protein
MKTAEKLFYRSVFMETFVSVMEMMMVFLFGISWPLNIIKAWKARTAKGTSLLFYSFIWLGYIFALVGKFALISSNSSQPWYETVHWYVMFFYILNILMVTVGIGIYFRNKVLDSQKENAEESKPQYVNNRRNKYETV